MTSHSSGVLWYLEGFVESDTVPRRYPVRPCPFRIGRRQDLDLHLPVADLSNLHAELFLRDGALHVRDLGSSNGTYVNGVRVRETAPLEAGDVLHFARNEFVVRGADETFHDDDPTIINSVAATALPRRTVNGAADFRALLQHRSVTCLFQPIVALGGTRRVHYEALGRGTHPHLPVGPIELFRIAETLGREVELSSLLRWHSIELGSRLPEGASLFVNTHPAEVNGAALLVSLRAIREAFPRQPIVVEISEATVARPADMRRLRAELDALAMQLAYDDFGAGQARLLELAEEPPDYLKFDMSLIRGIQDASAGKKRLVQSLVSVVQETGIACIAEGVETRAELDFCVAAGFHFAQGFYLGTPTPLHRVLERARAHPAPATDFNRTTTIDLSRIQPARPAADSGS